jgi:hypothetical protein
MPWWLQDALIVFFVLTLGPPVIAIFLIGAVGLPLWAACSFWSLVWDLIRRRI